MLLQAAKPTLMRDVLHGVIIQHCNLLKLLSIHCWFYPNVDLPGFLSPCIITGDAFRPDLLLVTADKKLFILELTVGFETNLNTNAQRKGDKYHQLLQTLNSQFSIVKFVNLSVTCLGIFGRSADSFVDMCNDLDINKNHLRFIIRKTSNIITDLHILFRAAEINLGPALSSYLLLFGCLVVWLFVCLVVCLFVCLFFSSLITRLANLNYL